MDGLSVLASFVMLLILVLFWQKGRKILPEYLGLYLECVNRGGHMDCVPWHL